MQEKSAAAGKLPNPAPKRDGAKARGPLATRWASIQQYCLGYGIQSLN